MTAFDVIVRNGVVLDGSGAAGRLADVGVRGDHVAAVGDLSAAESGRVIEAAGMAVAPGFIDMHSHSDLTLVTDADGDSKVRQGVTTEVTGQCGLSLAPLASPGTPARAATEAYLSSILTVMGVEVASYAWSTFAEYLAYLSGMPLLCNMVPLVGHGLLRLAAVGPLRRPCSPSEAEAVAGLAALAITAGAWGVSTGLIYPPGLYADTPELTSVARAAAHGEGMYFSHIRGEGDTLLDAVAEALRVGAESGASVEISHLKVQGRGNWGKARTVLGMIDAARHRGQRAGGDVYPYEAGCTLLASLILPAWAQGDSPGALLAGQVDAGVERRLHEHLEAATESGAFSWADVRVATSDAHPDWEGSTLRDVAEDSGREGSELALHLLADDGGSTVVTMTGMCADDVAEFVRHPAVTIGSDGEARRPAGPLGAGKLHPRSYGTFPRVLGRYASRPGTSGPRGGLSLEQAVHKMTGLAAETLGLSDRGRLEPGYKADLVVFDPRAVADAATFADPYQYPRGIEYVLVNGRTVVEGGRTTAERPGRVLRR